MSETLAHLLVGLVYAHAAVGVLLLPWWHLRGLRRLDASAAAGRWGFRLLVTPGLVALWPVLLPAAWRGDGHPRPEVNAHRRAASATRSAP